MNEDEIEAIVTDFLRSRLTRREFSELTEKATQYGGILDLMLYSMRRVVDPDLLSVIELETCVKKATEIADRVAPVRVGDDSPAAISRKVATELEKEFSNQQQSPMMAPLQQMFQQIMQQVVAEAMKKITPVQNTQAKPVPSDGNNTQSTDLFMGDDENDNTSTK